MRGALTRKQAWRRQKYSYDCAIVYKCDEKEEKFSQLPADQKTNTDIQIIKNNAKSESDKKINIYSETFRDKKEQEDTVKQFLDKTKPRKTVRFDGRVRVIQIPTIEVYEKLGLADLIWFRESEFDAFKEEAVNELRMYMINTKVLDSKVAIQQLYINETPETLSDFYSALEGERPLSMSNLSSPATSCDTVNSENFLYPEGTTVSYGQQTLDC